MCRPGERFFGDTQDGEEARAGQLFRLSFVTPPLDEIARGIAVLGQAIRESARGSESAGGAG